MEERSIAMELITDLLRQNRKLICLLWVCVVIIGILAIALVK